MPRQSLAALFRRRPVFRNGKLQPAAPHVNPIEQFVAALLQPILALAHPKAPLSIYYLAGALVFIAGIVACLRRRRRRRGLAGFWRIVAPRAVYLHPSARLDYRFYFVNGALEALIILSLIFTSAFWHDAAQSGLAALFGPAADAGESGWAVRVATTVAIVVAFDLGYWFSHWLLHRVPALWEFHKVHHSAEVLTPATTWRQHPVEELLVGNCIALSTGAAYAFLGYCFGPGAQELTLLQVNVLLFAYYLTFFHLRHSHIWMPVSGWLGRIVQSPAHHQIHHSTDPRHIGKNLGFCLSIWDWAFGTLCVPGKREHLVFGLGAESKEFRTLARLYGLPFAALARRWLRRESAHAEAAALSPRTPLGR